MPLLLLHDSEMSRAAVVAVIPLVETLSFVVVVVLVGVRGRFEEGRFGVDVDAAADARKEDA